MYVKVHSESERKVNKQNQTPLTNKYEKIDSGFFLPSHFFGFASEQFLEARVGFESRW